MCDILKLWYINEEYLHKEMLFTVPSLNSSINLINGFLYVSITSKHHFISYMRLFLSEHYILACSYGYAWCMSQLPGSTYGMVHMHTQAITFSHISVMVCTLKPQRVYTVIIGLVNHWNELSEGEIDCVPSERLLSERLSKCTTGVTAQQCTLLEILTLIFPWEIHGADDYNYALSNRETIRNNKKIKRNK